MTEESQIQEETVSSLSEVVKEDISKKMDTTVDEEKTNTETNENDMKGITSIFHNSILLNLLHHLRGGVVFGTKNEIAKLCLETQ